MAADELLLEQGRPALRLYAWLEPTLSLGYSQRTDWVPRDLEVVRRPSGGRALLHCFETTYCIVLGRAGRLSVREAYAGLTGLVGGALRAVGVPVKSSPRSDPIPPSSRAPGCMAFVQAGELTAGGVKLVGSAQTRRGETLLQHGAIPWKPAPAPLDALLPGGTDLAALELPPLEHRGLAEAFFAQFGGCFQERPWSRQELGDIVSRASRFELVRSCGRGLGGNGS